jgi:hypothetical protein
MALESSREEGNAVSVLRDAGLQNPLRVAHLISRAIESLRLDLSGLTVLTEAASGPFVVTPVIAAQAGAKRVIAFTGNSRFGTVGEVERQTRALEVLCGVPGLVEIHPDRQLELFAEASIVTNLGFVRPIDSEAISNMASGSVIALMCESWEYREGDLNLKKCREKGIRVYGTNEEFPGLEVFSYSGWVAVQLLLQAGVELHKSKISVIGSDKFARVIHSLLDRSGVDSCLFEKCEPAACKADAILVADYTRQDQIIGEQGGLSPALLAKLAPAITIVQFAGRVDTAALSKAGITVFPGQEIEARRMVRTLAALGPRPVIELHTAGLKVGELAFRSDIEKVESYHGLLQPMS